IRVMKGTGGGTERSVGRFCGKSLSRRAHRKLLHVFVVCIVFFPWRVECPAIGGSLRLFHFALWVTATFFVSPIGSWAIEAAPLEVELTHADDESRFWARPRGTEYGDWMETLDGYTVVESGGVWYYAQQEPDGTLSPSPY